MRNFLFLLFLVTGKIVFAQADPAIKNVHFCGTTYIVPADCSAPSEYEVSCSNYDLKWLPMAENMYVSMSEKIIASTPQIQDQSKRNPYKKIPATFISYPI